MRNPGESLADFYARIEKHYLCKTEDEANVAATNALKRCVAAGIAQYDASYNGTEVLHIFIFESEEDQPTFKLPPNTEVRTKDSTPN